MSSRVGYEWDAVNSRWKPVDYMNMTTDQLQERRDSAAVRAAEVHAQVEALLPAATAQKLLNLSAEGLMDLLITISKKAPQVVERLI